MRLPFLPPNMVPSVFQDDDRWARLIYSFVDATESGDDLVDLVHYNFNPGLNSLLTVMSATQLPVALIMHPERAQNADDRQRMLLADPEFYIRQAGTYLQNAVPGLAHQFRESIASGNIQQVKSIIYHLRDAESDVGYSYFMAVVPADSRVDKKALQFAFCLSNSQARRLDLASADELLQYFHINDRRDSPVRIGAISPLLIDHPRIELAYFERAMAQQLVDDPSRLIELVISSRNSLLVGGYDFLRVDGLSEPFKIKPDMGELVK